PAAFMCLNKYRFISLLTLVIASITILITQSRGSLILLFLVTLMYIVLDNRELIINKIKYIFWLILIVIVTLFLLDDSYFNRFSIGSNSRIEALIQGIKGFYSSPFGVGIGNTANNSLTLSSHNNFIHIMSEIG